MNLTVIGTGYVGLVTGACFAEVGNNVICVDIDKEKISGLKRGVLPFHEPGLSGLVESNLKEGRLNFATSLEESAEKSNIFFIAVGTPPGEDGSADLSHVLSVAGMIGKHIKGYSVIVLKSTVPVRTSEMVRSSIEKELGSRGLSLEFDVVNNPEFLREGSAVDDFMRPSRVVIGTASERAKEMLRELYSPFTHSHERFIFMSNRAAEMTKYAANAMLATRLSFMNEIADLCERLGVDVEHVRLGIGSDSRIGYSYIYPGCGYGGSCLPKDVKALIRVAEEHGLSPTILYAIEERNNIQKHLLYAKILKHFGKTLTGRCFAIWGLSFKPGTDDMREAPSKILIEQLIKAGASVIAYDPAAMVVAKREFSSEYIDAGRLILSENQYSVLEGADALVILTEWKSFRHPDFDRMKKLLKSPVIFDGRNQYDPATMRKEGFHYVGIGRAEKS